VKANLERPGRGEPARPADADGKAGVPAAHSRLGDWFRGLSAKLLALTIAFVMLAEVLIFVPSVANFRANWLKDRLMAASLAALAVEAVPDGIVPRPLREELLATAQVKSVAVKQAEARKLVLQVDMPPSVAEGFDLRSASPARLIWDAMAVFVRTGDRAIRVVGPAGHGAEFVEIVIMERPLRTAMTGFGLRILGLSIVISMISAALVYFALNGLLVRPIERMVRNMMRFSERPEDASRVIEPSGRTDEIGTAERQLAHMQSDLAQMLTQRARLAALGLAVSKINHDLRNMLATAHLISDRFQDSQDPMVKRFAPKLIGSLDRAIALTTDTMRYGRAEEQAPKRRLFPLRPLAVEAGEGLALPREGAIDLVIDVDESLEIDGDRDQLYRVLSNLVRNAVQALEAEQEAASGRATCPARIEVAARRERGRVTVDVRDSGPGVPERARAHLFEAFQGSARKGGTGLGLAIAAELVKAHGGGLALLESEQGALFRFTIPDRGADA
jgi:signal transduction histidine kinase